YDFLLQRRQIVYQVRCLLRSQVTQQLLRHEGLLLRRNRFNLAGWDADLFVLSVSKNYLLLVPCGKQSGEEPPVEGLDGVAEIGRLNLLGWFQNVLQDLGPIILP